MTAQVTGLLAIVVAYLLGAIPFGYLLTRFTTGKDVRGEGSGNIGATNVLRAAGRGAAVATLALDMAKGFAAVWIAGMLTDNSPGWMANAALAVMVGHAFPIFLGFKGGKAVATFIGAFLYLTPIPMLAALIVFVITVTVTRYISAASILMAATFPLGVWLIQHPTPNELIAAIIAAAIVVYRHKENLQRIRTGREPVFRWGVS
ncbi:MAG: acyl-phosphate glycerol-3-phosphate acyltransferase [Bryobacterales bacterium]|jgi:glycerol-3-phosphate acyltransferase PlsY|nr:acyl-phosphate glycerol-3-phosphate acyltransferase [Bryobacterales bacterium]